MKKLFKTVLPFVLAVLMLASCASAPAAPVTEPATQPATQPAETVMATEAADASAYPVSVKTFDDSLKHVEMVFEKAPEKVVCVGPNSVQNMIALGLTDKIIMVMDVGDSEIYPQYQEEYKKIPKVYNKMAPKEDVVAAEPDFILGWWSTFDPESLGDIYFWNDRGVKTYMAYNSGCAKEEDADYVTNDYIEREYLDILNTGRIFGVEDRAQAIVDEMEAKIAQGQEYAKLSDEKKVVILEDEGDVFRIYGEDTIGGQIATELGANLVAKTRKERKSAEELIELNPDIIFGIHFGEESTSLNDKNCFDVFENNPALQNITAYKEGNMIPTNLALVYSPGVILLESLDFFIANLYPDQVAQAANS